MSRDLSGAPMVTAEQHLLDRCTIEPNGCWIGRGEIVGDGYVRLWIGPRSGTHPTGRHVLGHVYAYTTLRGPIPAGRQLDHVICDTPACWNPWHVEPATPRENWARSQQPAAIATRTGLCGRCGEPLSGANLYTTANGARHCRCCMSRRMREYRKRLRERVT